MALTPMEEKTSLKSTVLTYTSLTSGKSFSDVDITGYDAYEIMIGDGTSRGYHNAIFIQKSIANRIFRVPLFNSTGAFVVAAEVNFTDKTISTTNNSYYAYLYGITFE